MVKAFVLLWICLEVTSFIWVGRWLGVGWTLLLIIASIGVGVVLLREQGFRAASIVMRKIRAGKSASIEDFADTPFVMLGAILLIIPGFFSDILGLLCFSPPIRQCVVKFLTLSRATQRRVYDQHHVHRERTFEGEYRHKKKN